MFISMLISRLVAKVWLMIELKVWWMFISLSGQRMFPGITVAMVQGEIGSYI
jgi:hypothetical protein